MKYISVRISQILRSLLIFLIDYFAFTQFTPAIFVQGISVLLLFVWVTVLFSHASFDQGLYQQIFTLLGLDAVSITSNDPLFWSTMLRAHLIVSLLFQLISHGTRTLRKTNTKPQSLLRILGLYLTLPTLTLFIGIIVLAIEPIAPGNTRGGIMGALCFMYLFAVAIVFYGSLAKTLCNTLTTALKSTIKAPY